VITDDRGWYASGRVPLPWRTITVGPFDTPRAAWTAAKEKHLGSIKIWRKE